MIKKRIAVALCCLACASPASAQRVISSLSSSSTSGSITSAGATVDLTIPLGVGFGSVGVEVSGTWSGTITIGCAASRGGSTYEAVALTARNTVGSPSAVASITANGQYTGSINGCQRVRAYGSIVSGSASVTLVGSFAGGASGSSGSGGGGGGGGAVTVSNSADVNAGATTDSAITSDTTGTMSAKLRGMVKWAFERMPASLGQKAMTASLPVVIASDQGAISVTGTFWQATQPVSGTFWQATQPVSLATNTPTLQSGSTTAVTQATGTNLHTVIDSGTISTITNPVTVASHAVTNAGTFAVQADLTKVLGSAHSATNPIFVRSVDTTGAIADESAHDAVYGSLAPIGVGGYASSTPCTAVSASGDKVRNCLTLNGAQYTQPTDGTNLAIVDPCSSVAKTTDPFSTTADVVIIAATSAKKNYICSITLGSTTAEVVNIVEGTGSVCATGIAALLGSTTDANGLPLGATGGFSAIGGSATVFAGKTANVDTCLRVNTGGIRVSGSVTWVQR